MLVNKNEIVIDRDFWEIFKPFFYFEKIFCIFTFNLKNGIASPASGKIIIASIILDVLVIIVFCLSVFQLDYRTVTQKVLYCCTYSQYVWIFCVVSITIHSKHNNIFLLLQRLQEVCFHIRNPEDTFRFKIMVRASCIILVMFYIFTASLKLSTDMYWHWTRSFFISSTIMFEAQLISVSYLMKFLNQKLKKWIKEFMKSEERDLSLKTLISVFESILNAYYLIKRIYQIIIMLHFVMTFLQILIYIEVLILTSMEATTDDGENTIISHGVGVVAWFIKGLVIEYFLCSSFEMFYCTIEDTRAAVLDHAFKQYQDIGNTTDKEKIDLIHFGKCIVRSIDTSYRKLWACGMFPIDVTTPLQLGNLSATYIIVLLQFAL